MLVGWHQTSHTAARTNELDRHRRLFGQSVSVTLFRERDSKWQVHVVGLEQSAHMVGMLFELFLSVVGSERMVGCWK